MITIRRARLDDLPALAKLEREFWRDIRAIVLKENPRLKPYLRPAPGREGIIAKWMRKWIRSTNSRVLITEDGSRPVGFSVALIMQPKPNLFLPRRSGFIGYVFVRRQYRGQGIASLLMNEMVAWLRKRKIKHVALNVLADNKPARAIWEKMGFSDFNLFKWKL